MAFVMGCQRSGTSMLLQLLDKSPQVITYGETERPAMRNYRLASENAIRGIMRRTPAQTVAFKPICDSHWTDRLLETYEGSKAIWIYRHYPDMVNSSLRKFSAQLKRIKKLASDDLDGTGWW